MILTSAALCMALNLYFESRGEPELGQKLVAQVTMNRAQQDKSKVCEAVLARHQFSWTKKHVAGKRLNKRSVPKEPVWSDMQALAGDAVHGNISLPAKWKNVAYFHSESERPAWAARQRFLGKVGNHLFYAPK